MNTKEVLQDLLSQSFTPFTVEGLRAEIKDLQIDALEYRQKV